MFPIPPDRYHAPEERIVLPEILDSLPPDDPAAIASRKDLARINFSMGNYRFLKRYLQRHVQPGEHIVEVGAGSGLLGTSLSTDSFEQHVCGLDLAPRPDCWPDSWSWQQEDLLDSHCLAQSNIILASLILHHFTDNQLQQIGLQLTDQARMLVFTEPLRSTFSHTLARLCEWTDIHPVTRHDMHVSIDAGFLPGELPDLMGLSEVDWKITEWQDWRGSLRMVALRK